jgi:hypothetical protein
VQPASSADSERPLTTFAGICSLISTAAGLKSHRRELQRDASLCRSIMDVLIPELVQAAADQQQEADDASARRWVDTAIIAGAAASIALGPELQRRLKAGPGGPGSLLHAAVVLITRVPICCPAELSAAEFEQLWISMPHLLGRICALLVQITQRQMAAGRLQLEEQQEQARSLLPALHTIAAGLQALLSSDPARCSPALRTAKYCCFWSRILQLLWRGTNAIRTIDSRMPDAPSQPAAVRGVTYEQHDFQLWSRAASAAVQALPLLAQAERLQRRAAASIAPEQRSSAAALAVCIIDTQTCWRSLLHSPVPRHVCISSRQLASPARGAVAAALGRLQGHSLGKEQCRPGSPAG